MEAPFFLTKIFGLFKRKKKAKRTVQTFAPRPAYIKHYHSNEWHSIDDWETYRRRTMSSLDMQISALEGRVAPRINHQAICARYHQVETLDGSEYYLCQHGVHIS